MKKTILIASLLMSSLSFAGSCPQLAGKYSNGSDEYAITQKTAGTIVSIEIARNGDSLGPMQVDSSKSVDGGALGGQVTQKLFCDGSKLIYQEIMMGMADETQFGLDKAGNLVISKGNHLLDGKPFKVKSRVYSKIQN